MLVKSVLDYIPECNEHGLPIQGSSIGLTGFYSVMSAMRNTLLYHPDKALLQERKKLLRGTKVDMADLIQKYIEYLERENSSADSVSSFYETHRTYLIGKLKGIQKFIFDENVNLDKELRDIFNNMFFKNVQMSYVAYTYDPIKNDFTGTDLKTSVINAQTYALSGSVASAIYQYKVNGKGPNHKYEIITDNRRFGEIKIRYAGKEFGFKQASKESSGIITDFEFAEFKEPPKINTEVYCDAVNCVFEKDQKCYADRIEIKNITNEKHVNYKQANRKDITHCQTFESKD